MVGHGVTNTGRSLLANITRSRSKVRTRHQRRSDYHAGPRGCAFLT